MPVDWTLCAHVLRFKQLQWNHVRIQRIFSLRGVRRKEIVRAPVPKHTFYNEIEFAY